MKSFSSLLPKKAIRRNVLWNVFGQGFPLLLAVFFIPPLIRGMGTDRFGALTLVWTVLTYFTLFDLGLGRSLTQMLARNEQSDEAEKAEIVWTASALLAVMGLAAAAVLLCVAPLLADHVLKLKGALRDEMVLALRGLGLTMPFLLHSLALRGILEAKRRFDLSNIVRIPLGVFTYGAPLLVLPFSRSLAAIVGVLLAGRILAWGLNLWMVLRIMPGLRNPSRLRPARLRELMKFGGWVTVTSVVAPIIDGLDRFFIGFVLSISVVAFYTTPYELISKLWVVSAAIGGAIFPEFAARFHRSPGEARQLFLRGYKYLLAALFPLVLVATAYAGEGLTLWLDAGFGRVGAPVLRWLALAMLIGGTAHVSASFLLGIGRPRIPALYDLVQLPVHAGVLYLLLRNFGLPGAAAAYALRNTLGFLVFLFFSGRPLAFGAAVYAKVLGSLAAVAAVLLAFHFPMSQPVKLAAVLLVLATYAALLWRFVLEDKDKDGLLRKLKARAA